MSLIKKILPLTAIVFIVIQFIRPAPNKSETVLQTDISNTFAIPENVNALLKTCYDCHSNNTNYPWYSSIQPMGWLIAEDIKDGKAKLNFNEFGSLSARRQKSKLQEILNSIRDGIMPLPSYTLLHKSARLTIEDRKLLIDWIEKNIQ